MKFSVFIHDIRAISTTIATTAAACAILFAIYSHFHTDAEAAEHVADFNAYQEQRYEADKNSRIDELEEQMDQIDYQLLSADLLPRQRIYLTTKRSDLMAKIKCIWEDNC